MPATRGAVQGSALEEGADSNLMKFSRNKPTVLPQEKRRTPGFPWDGLTGGSSVEKCPGSGERLAELEWAVCPSSDKGQQHPGLC